MTFGADASSIEALQKPGVIDSVVVALSAVQLSTIILPII